MNRRQFVTLTAFLSLCLPATFRTRPAGAQPAAGKVLKFAQIADVHMTGFTVAPDGALCVRILPHAPANINRRYDLMGYLLPLALKQIREQFPPDFLVFTGDQVDIGSGPQGEVDERQFKALAAKNAAGMELHYVLGNHDGPQSRWSGIFGPLNYTFDEGDVRIVVLNSGGTNAGAEQESSLVALNELKQAIATAQSRRLLVFVHQWINPAGIPGMSMARSAEIRQVIQAYPRSVAVINGHIHAGAYSQVDGVHYFTARAFCEPPLCFYTYELSADTLAVVEHSWNSLGRAFVTKTTRELPVRASAKAMPAAH
jgi:predicted MPP superfamily phosphohydrolase